MSRTWSLFLFFLLLFLGFNTMDLKAQEETSQEEMEEISEDPVDSDDFEWIDYRPSLYTKGDKTFTITIGTVFPTVFGGIDGNNHGLGTAGGLGSFAFTYFLNSNFSLGGELSGMFITTKGGNMFYMVPMGVRIGYQFVYKRFEFPLTLMIGGSPNLYLEENHFTLFVKSGASAFWRFSPDWSFGLNTFWWLAPQWPKDGPNVLGNFLELTLSARYHF